MNKLSFLTLCTFLSMNGTRAMENSAVQWVNKLEEKVRELQTKHPNPNNQTLRTVFIAASDPCNPGKIIGGTPDEFSAQLAESRTKHESKAHKKYCCSSFIKTLKACIQWCCGKEKKY